MTRKLQHTVTALSATATVFTLLLLAGTPQQPPSAASLALTAEAASPAEATALETATDAPRPDAAEATDAGRHLRRTRAALALPYFSFAQGLRRLGS